MTEDIRAADETQLAVNSRNEAIEVVKFGADGRAEILNLLGRESGLGQRIASQGVKQPVAFTETELKSIAYDLSRKTNLSESEWKVQLRVRQAIRQLETVN